MNILSHLHRERFQTMGTAQPDRTGSAPRKESFRQRAAESRSGSFLPSWKIGTEAASVESDKVGRDTAEQRDPSIIFYFLSMANRWSL